MTSETFAARAAEYRSVIAAIHPDWGRRPPRPVPVGSVELQEDPGGMYATITGCDHVPLAARLKLARKLSLQLIAGAERDTLYRLVNQPAPV